MCIRDSIRTGHDQHAAGIVQHEVVRLERIGAHLFDDGMAAAHDMDAVRVDEIGPVPAECIGAFGEIPQHVEFGDCGRDHLQRTETFEQEVTEAGGKVTDVINVPMGTTDFSSYFQRIKDVTPQVIYVFMPGGPMSIGMAKGFAERGFAKQGMRYIGGGVNERDLVAIGDASIGDMAVLNYAPFLDNPVNKEFRAAFAKKYGADLPTFATVAAYDGMELMFHMLKATGGKPDGDKMMEAAKGYSWQSPRGPMKIDPKTRESIQNVYMTTVTKENGQLINKPTFTVENVVDRWHEMHPPSQ